MTENVPKNRAGVTRNLAIHMYIVGKVVFVMYVHGTWVRALRFCVFI